MRNKVLRIRFSSSNRIGLKQVHKLLEDVNIGSKFNGPYKRENRLPMYEILVETGHVKNFIDTVGTDHPKKMRRFEKIIAEAVCRDNSL